tara:strand:- start:13 stop:1155 length:1143 start_codon:yes stop_codon:yes gene_type:complete
MADFYEQFNYRRYTTESLQVAGEDELAKAGMVISVTRLATEEARDITVNFKAFITTFNDTYVSDWKVDQVYGRADGVPIFKSTRRKLTIGFKVPAINPGEAYENLGKVQKLVQFLYPSYTIPSITYDGTVYNNKMAQVISRSPLVRIKFMNFVRNVDGISMNYNASAENLYDNYDMSGEGLLGAITNMTLLHHMEDESGVIEKGTSEGFQGILPKVLEVNLDFEPQHEHPLGWDLKGVFGKGTIVGSDQRSISSNGELFPYGVSLTRLDEAIDPTSPEAQESIADQITALVYDDDNWDMDESLTDDSQLSPPEVPAPSEESENAPGADAAAAQTTATAHEVLDAAAKGDVKAIARVKAAAEKTRKDAAERRAFMEDDDDF